MKKINILFLSLISMFAIACGDSMINVGNPAQQAFLPLLAGPSGSTGPQISSTLPAGGGTDVALNATITAIFNQEVRCSTVTASSFTLTDGGVPVAGSVACTGLTAIFTPSSLLSTSTVYTATVSRTVRNLAGSSMGTDHVWSFTTTATPGGPRVSITSPANGATNVTIDSIVTATFSEEVKCSTVTAASFLLYDGGTSVPGTVVCYGTTATFTPSTSLSLGTVYTGTITTAVENLVNTPMAADHVWTFTVEPGPSLEQKLRGIWVIGGASDIFGVNILPQLDLYDPVTDTWYADVAASAAGTYIPTAFGMAVFMSGKLYVMGGASSNATVSGAVYEYDIATNAWSTKTSIPLVRAGSVVYTHGDQAYILGGANSVTASATAGANTHYRFDPSGAGTWYTTHPVTLAALTVMPTIRIGCGAFNFSGDVSYAGGKLTTTAHTQQSLNDIYQWPNNTYTAQTEIALTTARSFMANSGYSGTNGTFFFLAGGVTAITHTANNMFFNYSNMTYVAQANSFIVYLPPSTSASGRLLGATCPSFTAATTTGIAFHAGTVSPYNGSAAEDPTFYIFGGIKNRTTITADVSAISANGTVSGANYITTGWVAKTAMPRARFGHRVVVAQP